MGPKAVSHLSAALQNDDAELRRYAAELLGEIGPSAREALPALIKALKDRNREVRNCAAQAISKIMPKTLPAVDLEKISRMTTGTVAQASDLPVIFKQNANEYLNIHLHFTVICSIIIIKVKPFP